MEPTDYIMAIMAVLSFFALLIIHHQNKNLQNYLESQGAERDKFNYWFQKFFIEPNFQELYDLYIDKIDIVDEFSKGDLDNDLDSVMKKANEDLLKHDDKFSRVLRLLNSLDASDLANEISNFNESLFTQINDFYNTYAQQKTKVKKEAELNLIKNTIRVTQQSFARKVYQQYN